MKKSELSPAPDLSIPTIPVICDRCRASGMAGDEAFAGIPDILEFDPVPRRAHANGWSPEHQRAFVAALAITGSARQAARAIGRHAFGAEQLRKAKGGRSFDSACEAALDIARDRERERVHANLQQLADESASSPSPFEKQGRGGGASRNDYGDNYGDDDADEYDAVMASIHGKLAACRRLYLAEIGSDPVKRAAWEVLCGPVDWDAADRVVHQPGETDAVNMRTPQMVLTVAGGFTDAVFGNDAQRQEVNERMQRLAEQRGWDMNDPGE